MDEDIGKKIVNNDKVDVDALRKIMNDPNTKWISAKEQLLKIAAKQKERFRKQQAEKAVNEKNNSSPES